MSSPEEFARRIQQRSENIILSSEDLMRRTVIAIDTAVVLATPVDTGRARANWVTSLDAPHPFADENKFDPSGGEAIAESVAVMRAYTQGREAWITNNLSYIAELNRGSSRQAPEMYVEQAIVVGRNSVKGTELLKKPRVEIF